MRRYAPCSLSAAVRTPMPRGRRSRSLLKPSPLLLLLPALLLAACFAAAVQAAEIGDYRVIRQPVKDRSGRSGLAIRSFNEDGVAHLLVIDPVGLTGSDLPASQLQPADPAAVAALDATPFVKALQRYSSPPYRLQNAGATRAQSAVTGVFLTVDLCPSRRPFERELFEAAETLGKGAPIPVAVAVSGVWLASHGAELAYLQAEIAAGRLAVTWVNHSYHHVYDPKAALERNFLLTPGTDFSGEVLDLERLLLTRGLVPSPFFRFPGLVSDRATVLRLRELSLIPIGSDAWLAKGESPRQGSFILVHGNGNEPKGVKLLLPMLSGRRLQLLALPAAFGN